MTRKVIVSIGAAALLFGSTFVPALAHDHLFNAAHAPGVTSRGFINPVAQNPSGVSGSEAQPGTVPGAGDPKVGVDTGTPAVDLTLVSTRSGGNGNPVGP